MKGKNSEASSTLTSVVVRPLRSFNVLACIWMFKAKAPYFIEWWKLFWCMAVNKNWPIPLKSRRKPPHLRFTGWNSKRWKMIHCGWLVYTKPSSSSLVSSLKMVTLKRTTRLGRHNSFKKLNINIERDLARVNVLHFQLVMLLNSGTSPKISIITRHGSPFPFLSLIVWGLIHILTLQGPTKKRHVGKSTRKVNNDHLQSQYSLHKTIPTPLPSQQRSINQVRKNTLWMVSNTTSVNIWVRFLPLQKVAMDSLKNTPSRNLYST